MIADECALSQCLRNLLSNAIRFSNCGCIVVVSARAEATCIAFAVEDDRVGICEQNLWSLGEPYFRVRTACDRRHGATGLVFSIVKALAGLHGGEVSIHNRVAEVTLVTERLPLDCERGRPPKNPFAKAEAADHGPEFLSLPLTETGPCLPNSVRTPQQASQRAELLVKQSAYAP